MKKQLHGDDNLYLPLNFQGIWLLKEFLTDENLTLSEAVILSVIKSLSEKKGYCYASSKYLSKFIKVKGKTTIRNMIHKLKTKGYIESITKFKNKRAVKLDDSSCWVKIAS